jgi:hypothetical protein
MFADGHSDDEDDGHNGDDADDGRPSCGLSLGGLGENLEYEVLRPTRCVSRRLLPDVLVVHDGRPVVSGVFPRRPEISHRLSAHRCTVVRYAVQ